MRHAKYSTRESVCREWKIGGLLRETNFSGIAPGIADSLQDLTHKLVSMNIYKHSVMGFGVPWPPLGRQLLKRTTRRSRRPHVDVFLSDLLSFGVLSHVLPRFSKGGLDMMREAGECRHAFMFAIKANSSTTPVVRPASDRCLGHLQYLAKPPSALLGRLATVLFTFVRLLYNVCL